MRSDKGKFYPLYMPLLITVGVLVAALFSMRAQPVHALPEFTQRTGESCATCHVNPGGGGPRTMRGLIWAAKGRPDAVPDLPGVLLAPAVDDGESLYQLACASCHGVNGEGMFGLAIYNSGIKDSKIESTILRGRLQSGMPAYDGKFTPEQLDSLVVFTTSMASGQTEAVVESHPLDAPKFEGEAHPVPFVTGGN